MPRLVATVACLAATMLVPRARAETRVPADAPAERIVSVDFTVGVWGRYPRGEAEGGLGVLVSTPWWLGTRWTYGQLDAQWAGYLVAGVSGTFYGGASALFGGHLYLGRWFSFEMAIGPVLGGQLGPDNATYTLGLLGKGGYVFHPWRDHRRRVKLDMVVSPQGTGRSSPGNDCPLCLGVIAVGLAYETPF